MEMENHAIRMCQITQVVSRDEKRSVGVREKQFVCKISMGEICKTLDMRYNIAIKLKKAPSLFDVGANRKAEHNRISHALLYI